ncbi:MAG: ribose-phosphate diphosphokinase, partial [Anaerolineae bacterium]|nr:ribose-phosphate diphosphokinase [Anaerolineae bacterium]
GNDATSEVMTVIGDVKDRDVVIVDDEISTAGSMKNTISVVKNYGARDVYVACTHPVFAGPAIERLRNMPIKELIVTNTVPTPDKSMLPSLTVLSVAPLIGEVIMRVHDGRSVGELFNE